MSRENEMLLERKKERKFENSLLLNSLFNSLLLPLLLCEMEPSEGHSTPRASTSSKLAYNLQPPTPLHGSTTNIILQSPSINSNNNKFSQASTSNSLPVQSQQQQQQILQATPPSKLRINNVVSNSIVDIGSGLRDRRQM